MKSYNQRKEGIRNRAIDFQQGYGEFAEMNYSWGEIAEWQSYFEKMGRRYGLLGEFRENGIC